MKVLIVSQTWQKSNVHSPFPFFSRGKGFFYDLLTGKMIIIIIVGVGGIGYEAILYIFFSSIDIHSQ